MNDFVWLINIEKEFKGYKYVFIIKEALSQGEDDQLKGMISELKKEITNHS